MVAASDDYAEYDAYINASCGSGCPPSTLPQRVMDAKARGGAENAGAIVLFALGGATAIAGAILVVLNEPTEVRRPIVTREPKGIGVAPLRGGGAVVTGTFGF